MSDRNFVEEHLVVNCTTKGSDTFASARKSDIYSMKDYRDAIFIIAKTSDSSVNSYGPWGWSQPKITSPV